MRQILSLKQSGPVTKYIEKFDDLRHQLLLHDPSTSNVFFVARFLEGLREDIRSVIVIHRPQDMDTVCSLALMQEEEADSSKRKPMLKSDHTLSKSGWKSIQSVEMGKDNKKTDDVSSKGDVKLASLLSYRKAKGLCFKCGDKWSKGHTYSAQVPLQVVEKLMMTCQ
jgi:hypothetical protein